MPKGTYEIFLMKHVDENAGLSVGEGGGVDGRVNRHEPVTESHPLRQQYYAVRVIGIISLLNGFNISPKASRVVAPNKFSSSFSPNTTVAPPFVFLK